MTRCTISRIHVGSEHGQTSCMTCLLLPSYTNANHPYGGQHFSHICMAFRQSLAINCVWCV